MTQRRRFGPRRTTDKGFSMIELLVVVLIIGTLVAIAIPSLTASKKAVGEQTVKVRLVDLATREASYRTSLGNRRYGTLEQMKEVRLPGGQNLLSDYELRFGGWEEIKEIEGEMNDEKFGFVAKPESESSLPYQYCIFEDGNLRRADSNGDCGRTSDVVAAR